MLVLESTVGSFVDQLSETNTGDRTLERREGDGAFVPRKTVRRFQFFIAEYMD
jgi:hypothetical protein